MEFYRITKEEYFYYMEHLWQKVSDDKALLCSTGKIKPFFKDFIVQPKEGNEGFIPSKMD